MLYIKRILTLMLVLLLCLSCTACAKKPTVAAFAESVKTNYEANDDVGTAELTVRGNSLVYSYKYKIDPGVDTSILTKALETAMEQNATTYTRLLTQLQEEVKDAESLIVEFLDNHGHVICSKEYK